MGILLVVGPAAPGPGSILGAIPALVSPRAGGVLLFSGACNRA
jgi:hypothetical protein